LPRPRARGFSEAERYPALGRERLDESGQVISRDERAPTLLVDVADVVRVDPLARPVEGDDDRLGDQRLVVFEPGVGPEHAAECDVEDGTLGRCAI
jgi:hypothetical protein